MSAAKTVERKTKETTIRVEAAIGSGRARVDTTVPFLVALHAAGGSLRGVQEILRARRR